MFIFQIEETVEFGPLAKYERFLYLKNVEILKLQTNQLPL